MAVSGTVRELAGFDGKTWVLGVIQGIKGERVYLIKAVAKWRRGCSGLCYYHYMAQIQETIQDI